MENVRDLRRRIKSVAGTEQMVRAMKMVSVSKFRRTQSELRGAREYLECCRELIGCVRAAAPDAVPPLMREGSGGKHCFVLLTGSRGLCGTYNHDIINFFRGIAAEEGEYAIVLCGRWGADNLDASEFRADKVFAEISDTPRSGQCGEITDYLTEGYLSGRYSRVDIVYQEFVNTLTQRPARSVFLPAEGTEAIASKTDCIFEPDAAAVLDILSEKYVRAYLYTLLLSAKIGEHSARMTAMSAAADNAGEMKDDLTRILNRARQSAVTTEMLELMGGAVNDGHRP